jgi:hypothetical protein
MQLIIGPVQVGLETDEKLSFDGVESLLNRGMMTAMTLMNAHMGAMVKYENYDEDHQCEECELNQLDSNNTDLD